MTSKERAKEIVKRLEEKYPDAVCALEYGGEAWKLLVLARLSAQCTDKRVNEVSIPLFEAFPTLESMANAELETLESIVRPCGLYHTKASDIISMCRDIAEKYDGKVPDSMDELLKLKGVGRKIANLMLGDIYGKPAIVADTHCIRLSSRLGLTEKGEKDPYKTEIALTKCVEEDKRSDLCHRLVMFGREVCKAQNPSCEKCFLSDICKNRCKK